MTRSTHCAQRGFSAHTTSMRPARESRGCRLAVRGSTPTPRMRPAFTVIETVVVAALILMLVTLILPTLQKVRDEANALRCQARLHQIGKYMGMYTDRNNGFFPKMFYETQGGEDPSVSEGFTIQTAVRTLKDAGVDGIPLDQLVCPADVAPGYAAIQGEGSDPIGAPISYSYNVGASMWGLQYFNMMDYTAYERWPVMFDGEYGPQIEGPYLDIQDFARQTIVSRHPIDKAYVLYADWHVEPLLEFRYRFNDTQSGTLAATDGGDLGGGGVPGGTEDDPCDGKNNNGHGNNKDGVDVSNPGQGKGGPNGKHDESGDYDDEIKPSTGKGC